MSLSPPKSIGIIRFSALGDLIWTLPLVWRLRKAYPKARLTLIVDPAFAKILEGVTDFEILSLKKPSKFTDYLSLKKELSPFSFDWLLCTQTSLRINLLYPLIKAQRKIGFDSKRGRDLHSLFVHEQIPFRKEHSLSALQGFADYLNVPESEVEYNIPTRSVPTNLTERFDGRRKVLIHPRASTMERTWSIQNHRQLIEKMAEDFQIILTGAPTDQNYLSEIAEGLPAINASGQTSLQQLAALFKSADLVIAPDSGPLHLAVAMGTTTLGLFAAVPPSYTGPFEQEGNCLNAYPRALEKFLQKKEEEVPWMTRVRHSDLMEIISVDEVHAKALELLKG